MNYEKSEELFLEAYNHNWDEGLAKLKKILKNANCDYGTALMIYWLGRPEDYMQYTGQSSALPELKEHCAFLQTLEADLTGNRYEKYIIYDPKNETGHCNLRNYTIPEVLYKASEGRIKGEDLITGKIGVRAWFVSAREGNLENLKNILNNGFDINRTDDNGTALSYICSSDEADNARKIEVIDFLIKNGIDINKKSKWGYTALSRACIKPDDKIVEIVDYLAQKGGDLHLKNTNGSNLIFDSAISRNLELLDYLLAKGLDPCVIRKNNHDTPLHWVFDAQSFCYTSRDSFPVTSRLLEAGVDPNKTDDCGQTALDDALKLEQTEDVKKSIELLKKYMKPFYLPKAGLV